MKNVYSILCLFFLMLSGCDHTRPVYVVSEKKMVEILTDIYLLEGVYSLPDMSKHENYTEEMKLYRQEILKKYNVSEARFDSSVVWYAKNPEIATVLYDSVFSNFTRKELQVRLEIENKPQTNIDTVKISLVEYMQITKESVFPFTYPVKELIKIPSSNKVDTIRAGDKVTLRPAMDELLDDGNKYGLFVKYKDGTVDTASVEKHEYDNYRWLAVSVRKEPEEIFGFIVNPDSLKRKNINIKNRLLGRSFSSMEIIRETPVAE